MNTNWILVASFFLLITGCTFTPQAVKIQPNIQVIETSLGRDRPLQINVVDERPKSTLGTRGVRGVGAELTVEGDLVAIVRASISDGLKRKGFAPQTERTGDARELRVEIRNLDYTVTQGFWSGSLRTDCVFKAICIRGSSRPYEQLYRGEVQDDIMAVQTDEENIRYVNDAVSRALNALLQDHQLSACLAE